jgi:hypothetical protein
MSNLQVKERGFFERLKDMIVGAFAVVGFFIVAGGIGVWWYRSGMPGLPTSPIVQAQEIPQEVNQVPFVVKRP